MRSLLAILALGLLGVSGPTVVVDDHPLHVSALEQAGRVLVPMRAIFEALGAGVVYERGHITAKRGDRRVELTLGNADVTVNGARQRLDVPAQLIGAATYVPLRFVATSLGANVNYDAATRIVTVDSRLPQGLVGNAPVPVETIAPGELIPAPNARAASAYPSVGAQLSGTANLRNVRMMLDGVDVTPLLTVAQGSFLYIPQNGLPVGSHTVAVTGLDGSRSFAQQWSFDTTLPPAPDTGQNVGQYPTAPYPGGQYPGSQYPGYVGNQMNLFVDGNSFGPGGWVNIHLTAAPNGRAYAYACTGSWRYSMFSSPDSPFYNTSIQIPNGLDVPRCPIIAMFVDQSGNVSYAPYPVFVSIYSNSNNGYYNQYTPTPTPPPTIIRKPPVLRAPPQGTPTPLPTRPPIPLSLPTPHQTPHPTPRPTEPPVVAPHPPVRTPVPRETPEPRPTHNPKPRATEPPAKM